MVMGILRGAAIAVLAGAGAIGLSSVSHADDVVCPVGMFWDVYTAQCLYYDVNVYVNPPNPIVGPAGPIGVGGVVGPVGPGPVGPGPVGPGPIGPGRR